MYIISILQVLVVSPSVGIGPVATELVGAAAALKIPMMAVVSKCDAYKQVWNMNPFLDAVDTRLVKGVRWCTSLW